MRRWSALLLLAACALLGEATGAAASEAQASFARGQAAFERGEFAVAQGFYEQALALGMDGPAVHFNIGVAAFRAGALSRAEEAFRETTRTPSMAALAQYNLGLVALQRGDEAAARGYFELAHQQAGDQRLRALAAKQLGKLPAPVAPMVWSLFASGGLGLDDNVALRSDSLDSAGSGENDRFTEILLAASAAFGRRWRADAGLMLLDYADLDEFDHRALSLGLAREVPVGAWTLEPRARLSQLALNGDVYENAAALETRATRQVHGGGRLRAEICVASVDGEGEFAGLSGARYELGASYEWSWQAWEFTAHLRREINDADEELFATRWTELGATAGYALSPRWNLQAGAALRRTQHAAIAGTEDARNDRRATLRLGVIARYWRSAQVLLRVERERNQSALDAYDYDRTWIAASIEAWY